MPQKDQILESFLEATKAGSGKIVHPLNDQNPYYLSKEASHTELAELELDATQGDPYSLAQLGSRHYHKGDKSRAFRYFDAVIAATPKNKGDLGYLEYAIAHTISEESKQIKYCCLAIAKGNSYAFDLLSRNSDGDIVKGNPKYLHAIFELINLDEASGSHGEIEKNNNYVCLIKRSGERKTREDLYTLSLKYEFEKFASENPLAFKALCMEQPHNKIKKAFNDNKLATQYFQNFQQELADEILRVSTNKNQAIDKVKEEFSKKYHSDYFKDLDEIISKKEKEIEEIHVPNILLDLERAAIIQTKSLLARMEIHLGLANDGEHEKSESLTTDERAFINQILQAGTGETQSTSTIEGEGQENPVSAEQHKKLIQLIKKDIDAKSIFLQLRTFEKVNSVFESLANPPPYAPQPGSKPKRPNMQKLLKLTETIEKANQELTEKNHGKPSPAWKEFFKAAAAAVTLVGIVLMLRSSYKHGSHKFWAPKKIATEKAGLAQQAALKEYVDRTQVLPTSGKIKSR